jgi:uncharacterized protein with FMN-binding domain
MRAPFVIGATAAGVVGIILFHPHSTSSGVTFNSPSTHAVGGTSTKGGGGTSGAPPAGGTTPAGPGSGSSSHAASSTTTTSPPANGPSGTASGNVTQYRFGALQVTATVSGGHITNVSSQFQVADPRSQQIDDEALPILRDQALSDQSADIQGVSGATYTSQAFISSLQNALGSLGFK